MAPSPLDKYKQDFLDEIMPDMTIDGTTPADWTGTTFLGRGSFGLVGLWEYTGPADAAPSNCQVAVKRIEGNDPDEDDMENEAAKLEPIRTATRSHHIVRLLQKPNELDAATTPDARCHGAVARLYFEYCEMGDLWHLIERRVAS
jgi:hypothetical protein